MVLGALGLVIVLAVGAAAGYAWYLNHKVHRINVNGLSDASSSGADQGTQNILMVGSTSRCALTQQNAAYGLCSQGVTGVNSDVVMILHLNPATHTVSILSIPRDLFVPNARKEGANKIDAALVEGPSQLVAAVQEDLGIPINHYVELNFDTFANVVNALGGVKMYFPEPVYDAYSGLNVQTPGCLTLNGFQALQVVRARHLQYKAPGVTATNPADWPQETQSDLARIRRDHEFLRVLATAISKKGLGDPLTDQQIVSSVVSQLTVDRGFSASDMVNMVLNYHSVNPDAAPQLTMPVAVGNFGTYYYEGGNYGDIEFPAEPQDQQSVNSFLGISNTTNSMTGQPLPSPSSISVQVVNGTGVTDQAAQTSQALQALGFHVAGLGDASAVGAEAETVVYYAANTPSDLAAAQTVARSISGAAIMAQDASEVPAGANVTVVTGTDFAVATPAPATTATTATTAKGSKATTTTVAPTTTTTTTTTASSSSSSEFSAPTPKTEALAPWDPRSCTPSGGEGP
jgi:LCP family protein required for cell wall assembly